MSQLGHAEYWAKQRAWFAQQQDEHRRLHHDPAEYEVDWREIPVFIINHNRLDTGFRDLVRWLLYGGTKQFPAEWGPQKRAVNSNVTVIDNASTYPPLLDYYRESGLNVRHMGRNAGPWVFWEEGMYKDIHTPYVVTDADMAPDKDCPPDLMERLLFVLKSHPQRVWKVGPGLRIDNIPDSYDKKQHMIRCEWEFHQERWRRSPGRTDWVAPGSPEMFQAGIDTTFGMYHPRAPFVNGTDVNFRLDFPYVFEHRPWYIDSTAPPPEEVYYAAHRNNDLRWSGC